MNPNKTTILPSLTTALLFASLLLAALAACAGDRQSPNQPPIEEGGADPQRGRIAFTEYGCPACHTIPGVTRADATVGPPLNDWANRRFIAGRLPNTQRNLVAWIMSPQSIDPGNAMPDVGVPEVVARDMAAYLYMLTD